MPKIRILVVDDSSVVRGLLRRRLQQEADFELVGAAENGRRAVEVISRQEVDVVTLDIEMPEMDGLTALPKLLAARPGVRVIMVSTLTESGAESTITALRLGAADFVCKPTALTRDQNFDAMLDELVGKIRNLVPRKNMAAHRPAVAEVAATRQATLAPPAPPIAGIKAGPRVLVVGSSTGGPQALDTFLCGLPENFTLPVLITQHMPTLFLSMLAQRLARDTGRNVALGSNGATVEKGMIYVAPGDHHMVVKGRPDRATIELNQDPPVNFCRPAVDPMFRSAALVWGASVLAVVLTGMGEDGRAGSEQIVRSGGRVLAQDEATSVVWGMPGAVTRAGLATATLPLDRLAPRIAEMASTRLSGTGS